MTNPSESSAPSCLFLSPEDPASTGGGVLRTASILAYLRSKYSVDVAGFSLRPHSKSTIARAWRNSLRLLRNAPPLYDRYSGYESQILGQLRPEHYSVCVIEHFWCAAYAPLLREHCDQLVLDLHNIESALAHSHAQAAQWPAAWASARFARAYQELERHWLPQFDTILVTSEADRARVSHPDVHVCANTIPPCPVPDVPQENSIVFSGNMEYHPNVEAVRWFRNQVWPQVRRSCPEIQWTLAGKNPQAIANIVQDDPRIRLTGPMNDAVTQLAKAKVCIVPLLSGSGTRFKILEAWAAARAVVTTTIGAEGLDAQNGEHLIIADNPDTFAQAIVRLCGDARERQCLGTAGRAHQQKYFTWPAAFRQLEQSGL